MLRNLITWACQPCGCETPAMWLAVYSKQMHAHQRKITEEILEHVNKAFAYRMPCGRRRCRNDGPVSMTDLVAAQIITHADARAIINGVFGGPKTA
jgi:hypothetical protein